MTTTCDPWQTTFFFNIRSNFKTGINGDPAKVNMPVSLGKAFPSEKALNTATAKATVELTEALRAAVDQAIANNCKSEPPLLGANDWETVWGPQVFCVGPHAIKFPKSHGKDFTAEFNATNAMYVVHSASLKRYIVAIAATNTPSVYDWLVEDADTSSVVAWKVAQHVWKGRAAAGADPTAAIAATAVANVPCISHATFTGTSILLNLIDTVITKKTLVDFLKGLTPPAGTTITFTGHSLAGALSPTLAMACFDAGAGLLKGSAWSIGDAMVYPTAGATPGNKPFASLFNGAGWGGADDKGKRPWQVWNTVLYNNLDIVPHAWGEAMLDLIPGLYGMHYGPVVATEIRVSIDAGLAIAKVGEAFAGAYTPIHNQALNPTGKAHAVAEFYDLYKVVEGEKPVPLTPLEAKQLPPSAQSSKTIPPWLTQLGLQHTIAYGSLLEIPEALMSNNSTV